MPEEKKTVDIDTSGPEVDVTIEEKKDEAVIETEEPKQETKKDEQVSLDGIRLQMTSLPKLIDFSLAVGVFSFMKSTTFN